MNRWPNISPRLKKHLVLKVKIGELVFDEDPLFPRGVMFWDAFPLDKDLMAILRRAGVRTYSQDCFKFHIQVETII